MPHIKLTEGQYNVNHSGRITKKGIDIYGPDGCYSLKPFLEGGKMPIQENNKRSMFFMHESNNSFRKSYKEITKNEKNQEDLLKLIRNIGFLLDKDIFVHNKIKKIWNIIENVSFKNIIVPINHNEIKRLAEQDQKIEISPRELDIGLRVAVDNERFIIINPSQEEKEIRVPDYIDIEINFDNFYQNNEERYGKASFSLEAFDENNNESSNFSRINISSKDSGCEGIIINVKFEDENKIEKLKTPNIINVSSLDNMLNITNKCLLTPEIQEIISSLNDKNKLPISLSYCEKSILELYKGANGYSLNTLLNSNNETTKENKYSVITNRLDKIEKIAHQTHKGYFSIGNEEMELLIKNIIENMGIEKNNDRVITENMNY